MSLLHEIYADILNDVQQNQNLEKHLKDVNEAILANNKNIVEAKLQGFEPKQLEDFQNDLFYLKWQIEERL